MLIPKPDGPIYVLPDNYELTEHDANGNKYIRNTGQKSRRNIERSFSVSDQ